MADTSVGAAVPAAAAAAPPPPGRSVPRRPRRRRQQQASSIVEAAASTADAAAAAEEPNNAKPPRARTRAKKQGKPSAIATAEDVSSESAKAEEKPPATPTPVETLVAAIRNNNMDAFRAVFAEHPELDVNKQLTPDGDAALVEACRYARCEMASVLLNEKHASVNTLSMNKKANRAGLSPLIAACMTLDAALVDLVLRAESPTPKLLHMYGRVNAVVACALFSVPNGYTSTQAERGTVLLEKLLTYAKEKGKLSDVFKFETEKGNRLVHIVAGLANWRALELLRTFGADLGFVNRAGKSPLSMVETNAFDRRSLALFEPNKADQKKKRGGRYGQQKKKGAKVGESSAPSEVEPAVPGEPISEAEKQTKTLNKKIDRKIEAAEVMRSYMELSKSVGFAPMFSRKGDSAVGFIMRCKVLAHVGFANLANEFALAPVENRGILIDGLVYTMVFIYSLSLKHGKEYPNLWKSALESKSHVTGLSLSDGMAKEETKPVRLSSEAFRLIMDDILANRSLSKRVQTMAMVLMHLEAPYATDKPLPIDATPPQCAVSDLDFYRGVTERLYRSGIKLLFCIFDRTDIEEDDSYDEEIEFHLLIALTELVFQFFAPYAYHIKDGGDASKPRLSATVAFQKLSVSVKKLWPLIEVGMHGIDDPVASPQRFSLLMHVTQVFEQVEAGLLVDEAGTVLKLFKIMKQFVKGETTKKRFERSTSSNVHLLKTIANSLPIPPSFVEKVYPLKEKIDVLIRSDPKIVGVDLYSLAPLKDVIRLEHKVDYLGALAEEHHGSVSISINRVSAVNHVDFILQQVLSTAARNMKGELNITLVNEPGVGVGVTREFFQIVQKYFFNSSSTGGVSGKEAAVPSHVAEIGSQWLDLARAESTSPGTQQPQQQQQRRKGERRDSHASSGSSSGSYPINFFPLFEFVDNAKSDEMRITARKVFVNRSVMEKKQREMQLGLGQEDVIVDYAEVESLKKLYLCAGRLLGLAIRNHQSLNMSFPLALWKFFCFEKVSWEEYCGSNEVFKRSLQFVLDHDFDASPLDIHFEFTTEVSVLDDAAATPETLQASKPIVATTTMEMQLKGNSHAHTTVTNQNKREYVELRAQQHFFGNEFEYYKKLRDGLLETIQRTDLRLFHPDELQRIVRGERVIDVASMKKAVMYSKGASLEHGVIRMFWDVVESFDQEQLKHLLTFWSGSPQPPLFGFDSTHRSMSSDSAAWYIDVDSRTNHTHCPMANTCDRRLILPEYPSIAVLKEKLCVALKHGAVGYDRM